MPRPRAAVPAYRLHKQSGQAIVTLRMSDGKRKDYLLGPYGSPESRAEYDRVRAEHAANPTAAPGHDITVAEILFAYMKHADQHYRRADGQPTGTPSKLRRALRPLRELYGHTPAVEFGPKALKAFRLKVVEMGRCRTEVNATVGMAKRVFKWAASEELIPASVYHALQTVTGLQAGRTTAREMPPVGAIDDATVDATLPYMVPTVRDMVQFQRLTGSRPGEVCSLRWADIDRSGEVWYARPEHHKTAHHEGKTRTIAIGPRAQEVLKRYAAAKPGDAIFKPTRRRPAKHAGTGYGVRSYAGAVRAAVRKANKAQCRNPKYGPPMPMLREWFPNQLRHSFATTVRRGFGLDAAQVILGHSNAAITEIYAERNDAIAADVVKKLG